MGLQDIDFNDMARRIEALPGLVKPGDLARIAAALSDLKGLPFPPGYLDEVRDDMFTALRRGERSVTYVYLAFFGLGDKASHLKIGISRNVKHRLGGIKTGNPLPNLWSFSAICGSRQEAEEVEAALLRHMAPHKVHGEWVNVHGVSEDAARAIVQSLAEVAAAVHGKGLQFMPHEGRS